MYSVKTIQLGMISGNVYLLQSGDSFILIDTGLKSKRTILEKVLEGYGCTPGKLKCIILTHGDFDHCGNALYFRNKFNIPVGIHKNDSIVLENGDMFINRKKRNKIVGFLVRTLMGIEKFKPDFYLDELDNNLNQYGFDAKVIHTPGHSPGSVCIVTINGDCFCGDLFENVKKPQINTIVDDDVIIMNSVNKIMEYNIKTIYPGHGKAFLKQQLIR
jgi:glyoxylase-like metal-dependent hydrolase (beta-lactamase superfamily II)